MGELGYGKSDKEPSDGVDVAVFHVTVVTLNYHSYAETTEALRILRWQNLSNLDLQIIVVDQDYIPSEAERYYPLWKTLGVDIMPTNANLGFAGGCNLGASKASGDYLLFLNNDAWIVPSDIVRLCEEALEKKAVAVGPVSNNASDVQNLYDFPADLTFKSPEEFISYRATYASLDDSFTYHRLSGFCLLVLKEAFVNIGGFDAGYGLGYFEDDDLSYKLWKSGNCLAVVPSVFVYHKLSSTFNKLGQSKNILMYANRMRFIYKNSTNLLETPASCPLVSVVVTTYNRPQLLRRALESITAQKYSNFEVILVNDGGQDVRFVMESFASSIRVRYINIPSNKGKVYCLNEAITHAKGKYVAYLDDDDEWFPEHLLVAVNALEQVPDLDAVYMASVARTVNAKGRVTWQTVISNEWDPIRLLTSNFIPNLSLVHRRSIFEIMGGYREVPVLEDWEFLRRLSLVASVLHIPLVTSAFYVRSDGRSRNGLIKRDLSRYLRIEREIRLSAPRLARGPKELPLNWPMGSMAAHNMPKRVLRRLRPDLWNDTVYPQNIWQLYMKFLASRGLPQMTSAVIEIMNMYLCQGNEQAARRLYAMLSKLHSPEPSVPAHGAWAISRWIVIHEGWSGYLNFLVRAFLRRAAVVKIYQRVVGTGG